MDKYKRRNKKWVRNKETYADTIQPEAQEKVIETMTAYDSAVESSQKMLDKRDVQRKDGLRDEIFKNKKSYEEILRYIDEGLDIGEEVKE